MNFLENVLSLITKLFQVIGNFAKINTCTGFFNEPEVPSELRDSSK
ncbi:cyclic lactone autoinducer peptide [Staphylococcus felis]|uniref:Cyclic lactone autoinducer peptide n=1 Tax=Staphylococcus felis TaxID=46127 RepID=A0A3E0IL06_9STAP|nr:cyclic lactone autoinducer peptide [Staphylococcus felis]REH80048.1 cyclic lactone autoinducer peptide [Staphylococcus felis]REH81135.1 cyclic lactone autoinducer peptide [Staphylococcus felis]REH84853.1 cyclic lactone autoinducer peptide [Staphylococcus felis]REH86629.1 cyclic lactone autoinducer peptide [Staphylococcus felis]REH89581.1 cyclic lactone autoinducer peptide [Staphylococcus felis]